jgi:erythromycin esterase
MQCVEIQEALKKSISVINSKDFHADNSDLDFLKEAVGNKRIVLLGEQDHGDGTISPVRARIIKYLHEEMDFNVIAYESDFFSYNKRLKLDKLEKLTADDIKNDHWDFWGKNAELDDYYNYLAENQTELFVEGFDCQMSISQGFKGFPEYFKSYIEKGKISFNAEDEEFYFKSLDQLCKNPWKRSCSDKEKFIALTDKIIKENTEMDKQYIQELISLKQFVKHLYAESKDRMKTRDRFMFANLKWLLNEKYKDQKIIVWAHNGHIPKDYTKVIPPEEIEAIEADGFSMSWIGFTMGELLYREMPEDVYSIGSISYAGKYNHQGYQYDFNSTADIETENNSLETEIHKQNIDYGFIDMKKFQKESGLDNYTLADSHNEPGDADWSKVFDAFIYIDKMEPIKINK